MTVRLDVKHSLLAGLVLALGGVVGGCGDITSVTDLDPEGPPKILQAFVLDVVAEDYVLAYGIHPDLNRCGFDKDQCDTEGGFTCNMANTDPATTLGDHCVDSAGKQPGVTTAVAAGASIRLIVKELLKADTVEQFECACGANCPEGKEFSATATNCVNCGDDPMTTTSDETGLCLDANDDGLADFTTLLPGIATITCGSLLTYNTDIGDGYYYPSGNQFPTSVLGYSGLGPAIVLEPAGDVLPTNTDCSVSLTDKARDKDNQSFVAPDTAITFHTEPLAVAGSVPADAAKNVAVDTKQVVVMFNTLLSGTSITAANVSLAEKGGAAVTTGAPTVMAGANVVIPLTAPLKAATTYEVTIKADVADKYNQKLPEEVVLSFTTK